MTAAGRACWTSMHGRNRGRNQLHSSQAVQCNVLQCSSCQQMATVLHLVFWVLSFWLSYGGAIVG